MNRDAETDACGRASDLEARVVTSRLRTNWIGARYTFEREVDSTNARVVEIAKTGGPHGFVFVADAQTHGRGRLGRTWRSQPGRNLCVSVLLRLNRESATPPPLSIVAGVAVAETAEKFVNMPVALKWPNDLLIAGRKTAGILVEAGTDESGSRFAVIGIGVNVNQTQFPVEIADRAGSLCGYAAREIDRAEVLIALLERLEIWIDRLVDDGAEPIIDAWATHAPWLGTSIQVDVGGATLRGVAVGLDSNGALRMRLDDGRTRTIVAGDMWPSVSDAPRVRDA